MVGGPIFARFVKINEVIAIIKIGLTGGIATGKSTVAKMVRSFGIEVIDADQLAHQALEPGAKGYQLVLNEFGSHILMVDGKIDRRKLGEIVFNDQSKLKKLEAIVHPLVLTAMNQQLEKLEQQGKEVVVIEMPLLYEAKLESLFDMVWVVAADFEIQLKRLIERNGFQLDEAKQRIMCQQSLESKIEKADVVIDNNDDFEDTRLQVETELKKLGVKL
ncbi:MAG TPA: dephospho-CoA kinase [Bacillota bacterium]|nr:dephospho-CoA kinase [Bacillota bacterium]HOL08730.1 dephospho-CoA kinase [Bacillota bacterium]HPO96367.1 dephospho-CoA kinase [Bacillota bacterium]